MFRLEQYFQIENHLAWINAIKEESGVVQKSIRWFLEEEKYSAADEEAWFELLGAY